MHKTQCMAFCLLFFITQVKTNNLIIERIKTMNSKNQITYHQEEVFFENTIDHITLAGTLTVPNNLTSFPTVILIAGFGPNDRNLTGMGHTYFKVLAEYLTQQGIAVLRYDKRGVGQSTGDWSTVTSEDLARDVMAGIDYLKTREEIDSAKIGLIGFSEGGLIASLVASQCKNIAFAILMAPHVALGVHDLIYQAGLQLQADGASQDFIERDKHVRTIVYNIIKEEADQPKAQKMIHKVIMQYLQSLPTSQQEEAKKLPFAFTQENADMLIEKLTAPSYRFFTYYDPRNMLKEMQCAVLVIASPHDTIVSCEKTFPILQQAFNDSGNNNCTFIELPNLNHMFQTCKTGALAEYATIKETIAPTVMQIIAEWILKNN